MLYVGFGFLTVWYFPIINEMIWTKRPRMRKRKEKGGGSVDLLDSPLCTSLHSLLCRRGETSDKGTGCSTLYFLQLLDPTCD